jgi:hypothetical protein
MTNDPLDPRIRELAWRRRLDPAEEAHLRAWLATHPKAHEDWEAEAGLNEALARLPNTAVSSNFTARVLQAVERESAITRQAMKSRGWLARYCHGWLPKAACAALILAAGFLSAHYLAQNQRRQLPQALVAISQASSSAPEILTNFDVICALDRTPAPDEDLLKLFQ